MLRETPGCFSPFHSSKHCSLTRTSGETGKVRYVWEKGRGKLVQKLDRRKGCKGREKQQLGGLKYIDTTSSMYDQAEKRSKRERRKKEGEGRKVISKRPQGSAWFSNHRDT